MISDCETQERTFEDRDQLAAEFTYFSDCILQDKDPEPSGTEGLIDVSIIQALYQSIETGQLVQIQTRDACGGKLRHQRPTSAQTIERPPNDEKPDLIHATAPSGQS